MQTRLSFTAEQKNLHASRTGYEDGIDDIDGPLWVDATDPVSVQLEAEGQLRGLERAEGHHAPASPVERLKHEEEYFKETVPALWGSEHDQGISLCV